MKNWHTGFLMLLTVWMATGLVSTSSVAPWVPSTGAAVGGQSAPTVKADPSGTWRWEYELGGEMVKDAVRLNLAEGNVVTGTYKGRTEKTVEIRDGKMDGDLLKFKFSLDFQGTTIDLEFQGKINDDDMDGSVVVTTPEGKRDYPWKPTRSVELEDVTGVWQLRIDANGNILEPSIEVTETDGKSGSEKYRGRYKSGQEVDLEVTELKTAGNQLTFHIATEINGTAIEATYKGRPYGNRIKGTVSYVLGDRKGDIEFTGTRKSQEKTEK